MVFLLDALASTKHSGFQIYFYVLLVEKHMSSVIGQQFAQIPANKLYINVTNIVSSIVDSNNNPVPWVVIPAVTGSLSTAGLAVLRDMGRNHFRPGGSTPTAVGSRSTIYRKIQLVPTGANGYYGTGNAALCGAGSGTDFYTGYISLGGMTYGGGNGVPSGCARLN
jgi:hypothetical protein